MNIATSEKDIVENILHEKFQPWAFRVSHTHVSTYEENIPTIEKLLAEKGFGHFKVTKCLGKRP